MKEISYGKSACILLFSALGVFSYFLLLYHTELQERIPDIKISLIALSITIAVFNLFGFTGQQPLDGYQLSIILYR